MQVKVKLKLKLKFQVVDHKGRHIMKRDELLHVTFRTTNATLMLGRTEAFTTSQNLLQRMLEGGFKRKGKEL